MAVYSLSQIFFSPLWGKLSDRWGRRPVLLITLTGTGISYIILGYSNSLLELFIGRTLAGVFGANISTAYAYVADITTEQDRSKGMGLVGAAFGLGFIFGPAIGGMFSSYGYSAPMFTSAAFAFCNILFAYFKLKEPTLNLDQRKQNRPKKFERNSFREIFDLPTCRSAILLFFLVTFALAQMETVFGLYLKSVYSLDAKHAGMLLAVTGLVMAAIQGGLIGKLVNKFGESNLILFGLGTCIVGLLGFGAANSIKVLILFLCILAIGHGVLHPSLSGLVSLGAPLDKKGITMGVFQSFGSFARVTGPPVAGFLYDSLGRTTPFIGGAVVLGFGLILGQYWFSKRAQLSRHKG